MDYIRERGEGGSREKFQRVLEKVSRSTACERFRRVLKKVPKVEPPEYDRL